MSAPEITDAEIELARLHGALEEWRAYLAGPCTVHCMAHHGYGVDELPPRASYDGHRHWTEHYEENRSTVVALNHLIAGEYDYASTLRSIGERRAQL